MASEIEVTAAELQLLVKRQAAMIGELQTRLLLLQGRVETLQAQLAAATPPQAPEDGTEPLAAPEDVS